MARDDALDLDDDDFDLDDGEEGEPARVVKPQAPAESLAPLAELDASLAANQRNRPKERQRRKDATDSEFWFAVCFETREQKEEFLRAVGLWEHGDKYLNGRVVAKKLGVELSSRRPTWQAPKVSKRLKALV